jgi:repressor LexA
MKNRYSLEDVMRDRSKLSQRQEEILKLLCEFTTANGYPPSVREIGTILGLSSASTVHSHLGALEAKGFIKREGSGARAIVVLKNADGSPINDELPNLEPPLQIVSLPVLGQVAAGTPILAEENVQERVPMPSQLIGDSGSFMLTVRGESMIEAGILDGDYVVVREQNTASNGDIVVALLGDEATVKTFYRETDRVRLQPENAMMEPIFSTDVQILGKVIALLRTL